MATTITSVLQRFKWLIFGTALGCAGCQQASKPLELRSDSPTVSCVYTVHRNINFDTFLQSQPSGSANAVLVYQPPSPVAVVAAVRIKATPLKLGQTLRFATTFRLENGSSMRQFWDVDVINPSQLDYRAIFGLPQNVTGAETSLVAG